MTRSLVVLSRVALAFTTGADVQSQPTFPDAPGAHAVVQAGLDALGGAPAVAAIHSFRLRESVVETALDQSPSPMPPFRSEERQEVTLLQDFGDRVSRDITTPARRQTGIVDGHVAYTIDHLTRTASPLTTVATIDGYRRAGRRLPPLLLQEALTRASTFRQRPDDLFDGRPHRVVTVSFVDGLVLDLWLDRETSLLSKHEQRYLDATFGDVVEETAFKPYREVGGQHSGARHRCLAPVPGSGAVPGTGARVVWLVTSHRCAMLQLGARHRPRVPGTRAWHRCLAPTSLATGAELRLSRTYYHRFVAAVRDARPAFGGPA